MLPNPFNGAAGVATAFPNANPVDGAEGAGVDDEAAAVPKAKLEPPEGA